MTDITKHFLVLGLDSTATLAQVKEARQWYTKAFHPDRFPRDSKDQKKAGEKQREINLAFEQLSAWFESGAQTAAKGAKSQANVDYPSSWHEELDEYMEFLVQSERSRLTIRNIFCDMQLFADWLESHGIHKRLDNGLKSLVVKYAAALSDRGYRPATVSRHLHSIRGWFLFCKVDAAFILPLASQYKSLTTTKPKGLTESQVAKLLASVKRQAKEKDRLLIEFLLHTGLTAGEVCALCWSDVSITNTPGARQRCVMLKVSARSDEREIPASEKAVSALIELGLNEILAKGGKALNSPIFGTDGFELTPKMVHYAVTQCGGRAKVIVTPSSLRNTFAYRLVSSGVPRHHLAEYLGISEQSASVYYPTRQVSVKDLVEISRKG